MKPPSYERVVELLRDCVRERGADYVYTKPDDVDVNSKCAYVHGTKPGCVVGCVLHKYGIALDRLRMNEGVSADELWDHLFDEINRGRELLMAVQNDQDAGIAWGEALENSGIRLEDQ